MANVSSFCRGGRIPLWIKLFYTAFATVLLPYYWHAYGPTNFLYFCDFAFLLTLPAIWLESSLLVSVATVGILLPQTLWILDFLCRLMGLRLTGITSYMFRSDLPLFARALSTFHIWLPLLLVWLVSRLGYDQRAFRVWTVLAYNGRLGNAPIPSRPPMTSPRGNPRPGKRRACPGFRTGSEP